ncbi:hypothetical protein [Roseobacter sp. HKCCA0434]|uniref:hypothetical protein n=1 Tax=Roseobacter sp. HKCCA0434 TaxID=3079297 RepID=UPI002905AB6E|nr:hypothetical protein [Roseobacter sp. HKCCA0434]
MRLLTTGLMATMLIAAPAAAQDEIAQEDGLVLSECLATEEERDSCVGLIEQACKVAEGERCARREAEAWQVLIEQRYVSLQQIASSDRDLAEGAVAIAEGQSDWARETAESCEGEGPLCLRDAAVEQLATLDAALAEAAETDDAAE